MRDVTAFRHATGAVLAGALLVGSLAGCDGSTSAGSSSNAASSKPPLILISIDTLRWDHLPAYGYGGVATPAIDGFRRDAVLFETAISHVPLTLPSHSSMLTGLLPPDHGVRVNLGYTLASDRLPFAPRLLQAAGYATGAGVSTYVLRAETGIGKGFEFFEDEIEYQPSENWAGYQRPGKVTLERTLPWLRTASGKPFFLFFHLYEPHAPYSPPEPYKSRYPLAYDGEIAVADEVVGQLLAELKRLGVYDKALIILTSDHGDALGDHDEVGHGVFLYRSTMQVPLLVKLPGNERAGSSVAAVAQLSDIAPTLLAAAGIEPPVALAGRDLARVGRELATVETTPHAAYSETYYTRLYFGWSELRSLSNGRVSYIESPEPELYDVAQDPGQLRNALADDKRTAAGLRDRLAQIPARFDDPGSFDPETRRKMESLGYLGGARSRVSGDLPAPATQRHLIALFQQGFGEFGQRRWKKAAETFEAILRENPNAIVAWEHLAMAYRRQGQLSEALAAYKSALSRSSNEPQLALATAEVLLALGQLDEARAHAGLALVWDEASVRELLARVALAAGDLESAERETARGLALRPMPGLLLASARIARQRGDLTEALRLGREAEAQSEGQELRGLYLLLGDVLARNGDAAGAEAAFLREIESFPADPLAPSNLAALYAQLGRKAEAVRVLMDLAERAQGPRVWASVIRTLRALGENTKADELARAARGKFPKHPEVGRL